MKEAIGGLSFGLIIGLTILVMMAVADTYFTPGGIWLTGFLSGVLAVAAARILFWLIPN
jgi:hypothetical protein